MSRHFRTPFSRLLSRLCHRRLLTSRFFFYPATDRTRICHSLYDEFRPSRLHLCAFFFFFSYFSPVTFPHRMSKRLIGKFHEKRMCQARYILWLWYVFLFKVVLEYRVDLECGGRRRRRNDGWMMKQFVEFLLLSWDRKDGLENSSIS